MNSRQTKLKNIRPEILNAKISDNISENEHFQNLVLRPIIKFQNDLLIAVFKNYIAKYKNVFYKLPLEKRVEYIENSIKKDLRLQNTLKGMILGHFTVEEYELYKNNASNLNKRILGIIKERLLSHIQLFNKTHLLDRV